MTLDISTFESAIARLEEGFARYRLDIADTQIRDGLVQRFEFTYEIGVKMLKRYLESASASPGDYKDMPFQDIIRSANEQGLLLGDWPAWRKYRDMRSRTSRTYAEDAALEVVKGIPDFLAEAAALRDALRRRLG